MKKPLPPGTEQMDERLQMAVPKSFVAKIDEWRRKQPDIPSRSEAVRRLVEIGLKAR